jgi:hypothetical protein
MLEMNLEAEHLGLHQEVLAHHSAYGAERQSSTLQGKDATAMFNLPRAQN